MYLVHYQLMKEHILAYSQSMECAWHFKCQTPRLGHATFQMLALFIEN